MLTSFLKTNARFLCSHWFLKGPHSSGIKCLIWSKLLLCVCILTINWYNMDNGQSVLGKLVRNICLWILGFKIDLWTERNFLLFFSIEPIKKASLVLCEHLYNIWLRERGNGTFCKMHYFEVLESSKEIGSNSWMDIAYLNIFINNLIHSKLCGLEDIKLNKSNCFLSIMVAFIRQQFFVPSWILTKIHWQSWYLIYLIMRSDEYHKWSYYNRSEQID